MLGIEHILSTLVGRTYNYQFKVKEDDLWQEDPWILDLKVISSRALIHRLFEVSHQFLAENVIGAQLAFAVTELSIRHLEPTPLGAAITLQLTVEKAFRNHISFLFVAYDEHEEIANGSLSRAIISKDVIGRIIQAKTV
jgi:predicted thioesterase